MDLDNTLGSLVTLKPVSSPARDSQALPMPDAKALGALTLQRAMARLFLIPFGGLLIVMMRLRGYRIEDIKALRKQFREITKEKKPLLICANHLTFIDSALLIWAFSSNFGYTFSFRRFPWNLPAGDFFKKKFHFRVVA